ncbi:MAG: hypothetical protein ACPL7B_13360 [Candidatus Poribacteria bacterium]
MTGRYNRERVHRLFLREQGNIRAVMGYKGAPKSINTIKRYAKEGKWYEELAKISEVQGDGRGKFGSQSRNRDKVNIDVRKLEQIKAIIYEFLMPSPSERVKTLVLKPKTYAEAVKCYLEVDSRIDEKLEKLSNKSIGRWEEIIKQITVKD